MKSTGILLLFLTAASAVMALTLEDFQNIPDNRIAVRTSFGLRYARPISPTQIEVGIGMSVTVTANKPAAYRIISSKDEAYAFEKFVSPVKAVTRKELDVESPEGCPFQLFEKTTVVLDLPFPMKNACRYDVVAQGYDGEMVTGAHTAQGFTYNADDLPAAPENSVDLAVLGLRNAEPVGNGILKLEFGPNFSIKNAGNPENYRISLGGTSVKVVNFGRISKIDTYLPVGWPFKAIPMHEIYLQLSSPYKDGDAVKIEVDKSVTKAHGTAAISFDSAKTFSNSIKVNQFGYLTDSPVKIAYLGRWMGSFPEIERISTESGSEKSDGTGADSFWKALGKSKANSNLEGGKRDKPESAVRDNDEKPDVVKAEMGPALAFETIPEFNIIPEAGGTPVFTQKTKLIHISGVMNEGIYNLDHSGENVYALDFSEFKKPGRYVISVNGVGRSLPFSIADDVYRKAFEIQAYGVFAQRCGIELKPPYSDWRRIACHNNGLALTTQFKGEQHDIRADLPKKAVMQKSSPETPLMIRASGGHHDSGDYNPRSHIDVAQKLMDAYEISPGKFYDGQLNIPEKDNGIPDILDEARWALKLWEDLQDADGGVRNGTESAGDPNFIQTAEIDPTGDYAYAKDAPISYAFAGAMAQASRIWKSLDSAAEADDFLKKAVNAYEWADKNPLRQKIPELQARDYLSPKAYASAQLLQTTGDRKYHEDFLSVCVWSKKIDSELDVYGLYDQSQAAWAYVRCDPKLTDPQIHAAIKKAIIANADLFITHSLKMAYAFIRHPRAPINWGTGAYENWLTQVVQAWKLTGDDKYKYWIVRTCDNTLGANPMGLSYIVGAGTKTVRAPLHNSRYGTTGEVVYGMQVEGPVQKGEGYRIAEVAYPRINEKIACLYTFVDNHFAIGMDEGIVSSQAQSMAVFGLLLPDRKQYGEGQNRFP